jgi:hypothetical protein
MEIVGLTWSVLGKKSCTSSAYGSGWENLHEGNNMASKQNHEQTGGISKGVPLNSSLEDMVGFIVSRRTWVSHCKNFSWLTKKFKSICGPEDTKFIHRAFRPFPFPIDQGLTKVLQNSDIRRWSMYIGANVICTQHNDTNRRNCEGWINRLYHQVATSSKPSQLDSASLHTYFSCCQDVNRAQNISVHGVDYV